MILVALIAAGLFALLFALADMEITRLRRVLTFHNEEVQAISVGLTIVNIRLGGPYTVHMQRARKSARLGNELVSARSGAIHGRDSSPNFGQVSLRLE